MSGGSWNYAFGNINDVALRLETEDVHEDGDETNGWDSRKAPINAERTQARHLFGKVVRAVAEAMHDIEWVDSYDSSPPKDTEAIDKALAEIALLIKKRKGQLKSLTSAAGTVG